MNAKILSARLSIWSDDGASSSPLWDDNGGAPDGNLWILPEGTIEGGKTVEGYLVTGYTGAVMTLRKATREFCGFSSRREAYCLDREVAEEICNAENT